MARRSSMLTVGLHAAWGASDQPATPSVVVLSRTPGHFRLVVHRNGTILPDGLAVSRSSPQLDIPMDALEPLSCQLARHSPSTRRIAKPLCCQPIHRQESHADNERTVGALPQ